jgi:hypothetical protein
VIDVCGGVWCVVCGVVSLVCGLVCVVSLVSAIEVVVGHPAWSLGTRDSALADLWAGYRVMVSRRRAVSKLSRVMTWPSFRSYSDIFYLSTSGVLWTP